MMKFLYIPFVLCCTFSLKAQQQTLTLLNGACKDGVCGYLFVDSTGEEVSVDWLPTGSVEMIDHPGGARVVREDYLNRDYLVTYAIKKVLDEPSDLYMDEYVISTVKLLPLKVYTERLLLTNFDCEMDPCVYTFMRNDSTQLVAFEVPEKIVPTTLNEKGRPVLSEGFLHKVYHVVYTTRKRFDYSQGLYYDVMLIREIRKE